nr:tail fiber protein [Sphingomonas melonis]
MSLETASYIHQLNSSNPSGADRLKEGDDHIRLIKAALKATFPGLTGPLDPSVTHAFLNGIAGQLVPRGVITLFAGETAPAGWAFCDGAEALLSDGTGKITTPDLRGRVPVGANAEHTLGSLFGQTSKTVTSEVAGGHGHTVTIPGHTHATTDLKGTAQSSQANTTFNFGIKTETAGGGTGKTVLAQGPAPSITDNGHTHSVVISGALGSTTDATVKASDVEGHAHKVTIDTTQPSIAVNFIIKV